MMILIIMPSFVGALKFLDQNLRKYMAGLTAPIKTKNDEADYSDTPENIWPDSLHLLKPRMMMQMIMGGS